VLALAAPRADCPLHLPTPPLPAPPSQTGEADKPLNDLQRDIAQVLEFLAEGSVRGVGNPPNGIGSVRPSVSTEQSTQGRHSERMRGLLDAHVTRTRSWQRSKASASASYEVVTQPRLAYGKGDDGQWHLNGLAHGDNGPYSPSSAPFITLSTYTLKGASGAPFCLDAGAGTPGIVIARS